MGDWTFFSNHGHVFFCLARDGDARLRDVAADVGITERAVQKIVKDLQQAGYIEVRKQGRCNRYRINRRKALRHPLEAHCSISKLVNLVAPGARAATIPAAPPVEPSRSAAAEEAARTPSEPLPETPVKRLVAEQPETLPAAAIAPAEPSGDAVAKDVTANVSAAIEKDPETQARERKRKDKNKSEPIDVRQQGSLF